MSRRDSDSNSRHHRSRFVREPSPKRVRRDGKTATERPANNLNLDSAAHTDRDRKHHPVVTDSKKDSVSLTKESDKKSSNGYREGTKHSSDNIEAPRSRSHFQYDERVGRSSRHRETTERDWSKDSKSIRATNRSSNNDDDTKRRDEKSRFGEQIPKKRPSFRETKLPVDADKSAAQVTKIPVNPERSERKEEREKPLVDRPDRQMGEMQRMKFHSRDRYGSGSGGDGGGSFRGRVRFNGRQGHGGGRVEKWKHDLYDEANKSPASKNEEDQIAKVEALLAS